MTEPPIRQLKSLLLAESTERGLLQLLVTKANKCPLFSFEFLKVHSPASETAGPHLPKPVRPALALLELSRHPQLVTVCAPSLPRSDPLVALLEKSDKQVSSIQAPPQNLPMAPQQWAETLPKPQPPFSPPLLFRA